MSERDKVIARMDAMTQEQHAEGIARARDRRTVARAARVIARHHPSGDRTVCFCGGEWHPRHVAEQLLSAGCLDGRESREAGA